MDKKRAFELAKKYALLTLGCAFLAFGSVAFLTPFDLVTGGVFSIAVITQHFVTAAGSTMYVIDIVAWVAELSMLILAFAALGKSYALRSLFATLLYPAFVTFLGRVPLIDGLTVAQYFANVFEAHSFVTYLDPAVISSLPEGVQIADWGLRILAGLAGGVFIGLGVAVCYNAGGSTGGLDVVSSLIAKHTPVKEGTSAFIMDSALVILGILLLRDLPNGLVGVLSAFMCALVIQLVYVSANKFVIADIISSEADQIREYVEKVMDRTTTIIDVTGGYTGTKRKLLRVAFSKSELPAFRAFIASVDPRAFVTFTQAAIINGEGFEPLSVRKNRLKFLNLNKDNEDLHG